MNVYLIVPYLQFPQDFADLKDKPNHRIPNFSHLLNKYSTRNKIKSPSKESAAELVDAAAAAPHPSSGPRGAIATLGGADDERARRVRKLYDPHSPAAALDAPPRRSRKRRSHDKFGNMVSARIWWE